MSLRAGPAHRPGRDRTARASCTAPGRDRPSVAAPRRLRARRSLEGMSILRPKPQLVTAENALPGRAGYPYSVPETHYVTGRRIREPFEREGLKTAVFGMGCFWGAEKELLAARQRLVHRRGLRRRVHPVPDLRGDLHRTDRARRDGQGDLRPGRHQLRRAAEASSSRTTTRPRACARATTSAASTARRSSTPATPSASRSRPPPRCSGKRLAGPATVRSPPRSPRCAEFYYAEDYHQQYLAKNPYGYCPVLATGVSCPVGLFAPSS